MENVYTNHSSSFEQQLQNVIHIPPYWVQSFDCCDHTSHS